MNGINNSSIDPAEVAFFRRLSAVWWDQNGPFRPLHQLNELRIQWIVRQLTLLGMASESEQRLKEVQQSQLAEKKAQQQRLIDNLLALHNLAQS